MKMSSLIPFEQIMKEKKNKQDEDWHGFDKQPTQKSSWDAVEYDCETCNGTGQVHNFICPECDGAGG